jgi:hypothetical protein
MGNREIRDSEDLRDGFLSYYALRLIRVGRTAATLSDENCDVARIGSRGEE